MKFVNRSNVCLCHRQLGHRAIFRGSTEGWLLIIPTLRSHSVATGGVNVRVKAKFRASVHQLHLRYWWRVTEARKGGKEFLTELPQESLSCNTKTITKVVSICLWCYNTTQKLCHGCCFLSFQHMSFVYQKPVLELRTTSQVELTWVM